MAEVLKINGRSVRRGETTAEELAELTADFNQGPPLLEEYLDEGVLESHDFDYLVVDGDLVVDGNFDMEAAGLCFLVVKGNLIVEGCYSDQYDHPATGVFVLGNLRARDVSTHGALGVQGDLVAARALVGDYNDYGAEVKGSLRAKIFFPENHAFEVGGDASFEYVLGEDAGYWTGDVRKPLKSIEGAALAALLVPEVIYEGAVAHSEFKEVLQRGAELFR